MRGGTSQLTVKTREVNGWSFDLMPADGFFEHSRLGLPVLISNTSFPAISGVYQSISSSGDLSTHFDPFHILAEVVYLFSNNLHGEPSREFACQLFDNLSRRVPRGLLLSIFKRNELSIRAVWESLFTIAWDHKIKIGLRLQPDWMDDRRHEVLFAAVLIGDSSTVARLLDKWRSWNPRIHANPTCFGAAASCGAIDCAKLLLENCDPNAKMDPEGLLSTDKLKTIFSSFLFDFGKALSGIDRSTQLHDSESPTAYSEILTLFVEAGADVDTPYPSPVFGNFYFGWDMTCLDICLYLPGSVLESILPSSRRWNSEITRAGIGHALLQGQSSLAEYLDSRPAPSGMKTSECLRILLIEHLEAFEQGIFGGFALRGRRELNSSQRAEIFVRARALLEYGVSMRSWHRWNPTSCLNLVLKSATGDGIEGDLSYLLEQSLNSGADIEPSTYTNSIKKKGTSVLKILMSVDIDFQANGGEALLRAAREGNFEAISLLLDEGVDINREVYSMGTILSPLLIRRTDDAGRDFGMMRRVWEIFVRNGAELRLRRGQATSYQLLRAIIYSKWEAQVQAFQFVMSSDRSIEQLPASKWANLFELAAAESECDIAIIKPLFQRCGSISQPFLAQAVRNGCDLAFMNELLDAGQDVNGYSGGYSPLQAACACLNVDMVIQLLERHADINLPIQHEAQPWGFPHASRQDPLTWYELVPSGDLTCPGMTALQLACGFGSGTRELRKRQEDLVKLLVHHGADINAKPDRNDIPTALQLLCAKEYTDPSEAQHVRGLIHFLIDNGADVNLAPALGACSALQVCAYRGDIERAMILVQHCADPNLHPVPMRRSIDGAVFLHSALDLAAGAGRLDMTQYLLNIDAFSGTPGETGYQGALDGAWEKFNHAVAEVIRNHIEKLDQDFKQDPQIRSRHMELLKEHENALNQRKIELSQLVRI
jgi:ankyrin repeat protein